MDIEKLATSAVEDAIARTEFLSSFVNSGDKEPFWDGHIYAYSDKSKKNKYYIGRAPVQVKGKLQEQFSEEKFSYSIRVVDLRSYRKEGGTIYFVVQINKDGTFKKIYYKILLPRIIDSLLKNTKAKKNISMFMNELPADKNKITKIVVDFIKAKEHQNMTMAQLNVINLQTVIENEKSRLAKQAILPWFSDSKRYCDLFPKLFIKPNLVGRMMNINYDSLQNYHKQNIAILGEAGAGKTTLLIYYFTFELSDKSDGQCLYLTAKEALGTVECEFKYVEKICKSIPQDCMQSLTILIDGIDEEFLNDYKGYIDFLKLLKRLSDCYSCFFWIGCRKDLFEQYRGEASQFVYEEFVISPWVPEQATYYINEYESIVNCKGLRRKTEQITGCKEIFEAFSKNPFQLSLLVYIAEYPNSDGEITTVYELYNKFFEVWFQKEKLRGTTECPIKTILYPRLQKIAKEIYANNTVVVENCDIENSAIRNLLIIKKSSYQKDMITAMYHRSLVSFLMAELIFQNMLDSSKIDVLMELFQMRIQDDVTNFIGSKYTIMSMGEKKLIKANLIKLYHEVENKLTKAEMFVVKEKCIYHLTRMDNKGVDGDVTNFLLEQIKQEPENPYMRLTLAYGCALSNNETVRAFALKFAKSIYHETEDAVVNRSWTLVYYGDIADDPYSFKDDNQCSWSKAREARTSRFSKNNPRLKDYRFQLFDLPLIYSFLKNRGWNDISKQEYQIISSLSFSEKVFFASEIAFLSEVKDNLLKEYEYHLSISSTPSVL